MYKDGSFGGLLFQNSIFILCGGNRDSWANTSTLVFSFCWNYPWSWFHILLAASMYCGSKSVPRIYLASLDFGV